MPGSAVQSCSGVVAGSTLNNNLTHGYRCVFSSSMSISSSVIGSNGKGAEPLWDNAEFFWAHVVTSFAETEKNTMFLLLCYEYRQKRLLLNATWKQRTLTGGREYSFGRMYCAPLYITQFHCSRPCTPLRKLSNSSPAQSLTWFISKGRYVPSPLPHHTI